MSSSKEQNERDAVQASDNETSIKRVPTEQGGKRVISAGITTGSRRTEVKTGADGDVNRIAKVGVTLLGASARHGRPSDRVERREIES